MPAASTAKSFIAGTDQVPIHPDAAARPQAEPGYRVIRRNGAVTPFDATKITVALTKAFLAVEGSTAAGSRRVHDTVTGLTEQVVAALTRRVGELAALGVATHTLQEFRLAGTRPNRPVHE